MFSLRFRWLSRREEPRSFLVAGYTTEFPGPAQRTGQLCARTRSNPEDSGQIRIYGQALELLDLTMRYPIFTGMLDGAFRSNAIFQGVVFLQLDRL